MAKQIQGDYFGEGGKLFGLYLKTVILTLLTLGIYRFWARTRIRKYVWSAISGDGDNFEYTGTGLEKFLGFLMAIVILAIYLGIVQMLLFLFGFNLFVEPSTYAQVLAQLAAIYITIFAVLPLLLFAEYRARRYRMARSRWRGIRFGMENGAWGYAFRALGYYLLNIITLGLLTPLVSFKLEKYMVDRSWYGDALFVQNGRWQSLYPGMKYFLIGLVVGAVSIGFAVYLESETLGIVGATVGYFLVVLGLVYFRIYTLNYVTRQKLLDGKVGFSITARTGKVVGIVLLGGLAMGLFLLIIGAVMGGLFASAAQTFVTGSVSPVLIVVLGLLYAGAFLIVGGLSLVFITQPIIWLKA